MNKIFTIIVCLLLASCAKPTYIAAKCPRPIIPVEPSYPITNLTDADKTNYGKIQKSMVQTIQMQKNYIKELQIRCGGN